MQTKWCHLHMKLLWRACNTILPGRIPGYKRDDIQLLPSCTTKKVIMYTQSSEYVVVITAAYFIPITLIEKIGYKSSRVTLNSGNKWEVILPGTLQTNKKYIAKHVYWRWDFLNHHLHFLVSHQWVTPLPYIFPSTWHNRYAWKSIPYPHDHV